MVTWAKVLLEISVEQLRLVGERRDRRIRAHRAYSFLAGGCHRRDQQLDVFLRVAKGLLQVEKAVERRWCLDLHLRQILDDELGVLDPFGVRMRLRHLRLDLFVRHDAAGFEIDEQHLAGLQAQLLEDTLFGDRQDARFRGEDHAVIVGHDIARRPQAVAVERSADRAAIGEADGGRTVPLVCMIGAA